MYYTRTTQVADVDFDTNDVEDAIEYAARDAAEGFGPYNDDIEQTAESIYLAVEGRIKELEGKRDDLGYEIDDLEEQIDKLRGQRDDLNDAIDELEAYDQFDVERIVKEQFAEYAEEEDEE